MALCDSILVSSKTDLVSINIKLPFHFVFIAWIIFFAFSFSPVAIYSEGVLGYVTYPSKYNFWTFSNVSFGEYPYF